MESSVSKIKNSLESLINILDHVEDLDKVLKTK
jgi:hypothetical protein